MFADNNFIVIFIITLGFINIIRMGFFMLGSNIYTIKQGLRKRKEGQATFHDSLPNFSVIIPAHNEESTIVNTIQSVIDAHYPKDKLEIIVVDDGSTDKTYALAKQYELQSAVSFKLVNQKNAGKAHALNNGMINYASGELLMCLDADSHLDSNALINTANYFKDERVVALSANVKIRETKGLFNLIQMFEYLVCYQMKRALTIFNIEYIIGGVGSTFRKSALVKVGYYDTNTITEDIDLTMKLISLGNKQHRVIYGSDVVIYTESVLNIAGLIRQRFRWKYGRAQTFIKNRRLFFSLNKKNSLLLTCFYLPYAVISDIIFFFEPFMISYVLYTVIKYKDFYTIIIAFIIVSAYLIMNIFAENTVSLKQKIRLTLIAPFMYFLFYILSYVEYLALLKTYIKFWQIPKSLKSDDCRWIHVQRPTIQKS